MTEKTMTERLAEKDFVVIMNDDKSYTIKSANTGAVLQANASERDLRSFETGMNYITQTKTRAINETYLHTRPAHW